MASVLEIAAVLAGATAVAGSMYGLLDLATERSERAEQLFDKWYSHSRESRRNQARRGRPVSAQAIAGGIVRAVQSRNRQTSAQKLMRIRRVDAKTGGNVTITSAIVHYLVSQAIDLPLSHVTHRAADRRGERLKALAPDLRRLTREHPDDTRGLLRDGYKLIHERGANMFTPLGLSIVGRIAFHVGCVLVSPRRQSLPDLLAGIVTVESPEGSSSLCRPGADP